MVQLPTPLSAPNGTGISKIHTRSHKTEMVEVSKAERFLARRNAISEFWNEAAVGWEIIYF